MTNARKPRKRKEPSDRSSQPLLCFCPIPPPPASACSTFQGSRPLLRGGSRPPHGAGRERRRFGTKKWIMVEAPVPFSFFFPFAILKEHFRMWRRRALCCACGPLGCFSFMRRWCAQMTDMKRKSCGAEHATDNTQKSTKKKKTRSTAVFLPLAFTTLPSPAHCPGRSPLARSCAS